MLTHGGVRDGLRRIRLGDRRGDSLNLAENLLHPTLRERRRDRYPIGERRRKDCVRAVAESYDLLSRRNGTRTRSQPDRIQRKTTGVASAAPARTARVSPRAPRDRRF